MQTPIRCIFMRGGTSRGPFFLRSELPSRASNPALLDAVLLRTLTPMIDSLAGASSVTTKTALIGPGTVPGAHLDMHFAQVDAAQRKVDWSPLCGNMLSAVVPFAMERGLLAATERSDVTDAVVHNVSTGALVDVRVQTPAASLTYDGECAIAGVDGTGSPIDLRFRNIAGAKTGHTLPTGAARDQTSAGIPVSVVDVATPVMFVRAEDLGKTAQEPAEQLSADDELVSTLLAMRNDVKARMPPFEGRDDPRSVLPKIVLVGAPATSEGHLSARYFTPWACHPSYAVGGAVCTAAAAALPGSVVGDVVQGHSGDFASFVIEHPSGSIIASLDASVGEREGELDVRSGGCVRTARKIMDGHVYVPSSIWDGSL